MLEKCEKITISLFIGNIIDLLLKTNINRRDSGSFMANVRITILEVYETLQSGFSVDYNNDETSTIKICTHIRIDDGES